MTSPKNSYEVINADGYLKFGSLWVPSLNELDISVEITQDDKQLLSLSLIYANSIAKVEVFAAAKDHSSWTETRFELAAKLEDAKVQPKVMNGTFGAELSAIMPTFDAQGIALVQAVRFLGIDGDRWFMRVTVSGNGATDPVAISKLDELISQLVVDRGEHAMSPGSRLPLTLPSSENVAVTQDNLRIEI